jgi:hypothetical protein
MKDLLNLTIEAHGGLTRWKKFESITAKLSVDGVLWPMKQQAGTMANIQVSVSTKRQYATHFPFLEQNWRTSFEPGRIAIEHNNGKTIDELINPRESFNGHVVETPWSNLQLAYFAGYAMCTYFNAPFIFEQPTYTVKEIELWEEHGETFRRLQVEFPAEVATHSNIQTFYINEDGLIGRHDYNVDILGNSTAVHYLSDYKEVQGIKIATKRRVYVRLEDNTALLPEPLLVSIDLSNIVLN